MYRLLTILLLIGLSIPSFAQSFTIAQSYTGNPAVPTRGQSFKAAAQGSGSGSTGSSNTVILKSFSMVYHVDATSEASKLYIYRSMPSSAATLTDGTSGTLIAESVSKTEDFPYTIYNFNDVELDKNTTYYALFREDVALESGSASDPGPYNGGQMIRNNSGTLTPLSTADLRMIVNFEQFQAPSMSVWTSATTKISSGGFVGSNTVKLNVVATKTFTIKNEGSGVLNIGTVAATGTGISVSVQPASTVNAGGSTTFEITYSSAVKTNITYNISIPSNDPLSPFLFRYIVSYDYPVAPPVSVYAVNVRETQINVYWEDQSNEHYFSIERSLSSSSGFLEVGKVNGGQSAPRRFEDTTVTAGVAYYYRVRGIFGSDVSPYVYTNLVKAASNTLGDWKQKASYPGIGRKYRMDPIGFSIGTKGYFGTGYDNSSNHNDFWEYDPATDTWTRKADYAGGAREAAVEFVINGKAYVGLGFIRPTPYTYKKDFYVYDPSNNTWSAIAEFPGEARAHSAAFVLNGKAYVGLGARVGSKTYNDFYEYDPTQNTWRQVANFPKTGNASGFAIDNIGYVYTDTEFYAFDPSIGVMGTWTKKADLEFSASSASNFVINNKAFIIGGKTYTVQVYNPSNNTWTLDVQYPSRSYSYTSAFAIGNFGYVGLGVGYGTGPADLWEYNPVSPKLSEITGEAFKNKIILRWKDNADNETGYVLERGQAATPGDIPQNFTIIANLEAGVVSYTDIDVVQDTFYTYHIRTKFPEGESYNKSITAVIEYPSILKATKIDETSVNFEWTALTLAAGYVIEKATSTELDGSVFAFTVIQTISNTSYTTGMSNEGFYYFRIKGDRPSYPTSTLYSDTVKVLMIKAPSNLHATISANSNLILRWLDRSPIETGYVIERKKSSEEDYTTIASLGANTSTYTDMGTEPDTQYMYRIKAVKDNYDSFYAISDMVTVPILTGIEKPSSISLEAFPNPAEDILVVSIPNGDQLSVPARVVATDGRIESISSRSDKDVITYDVSDLKKGLYILIINTKKGVSKIKFLKN